MPMWPMRPPWRPSAPRYWNCWTTATCAGSTCLRFDLPFLSEELYRVGIDWDYDEAACGGRAADLSTSMEPRNLSAALRFYCGKEHDGAHDALADVEATADVLLAQLGPLPRPAP